MQLQPLYYFHIKWNSSRSYGSMRAGSFFLAILLYLVALSGSWVWTVYNSLINLRNNVKRAWAQIDIQLKRRYDLIPNLIQIVKGYRDYENQLLELISKLRAQSIAPASNTENLVIQGLAPLLEAVVEQYPELKLKANDPFVRLQNSLIETEERIALARDYFNTTTTFYNTRLESIPDRYVGNLAKLSPQNLLKSVDIERAQVQVQLENNKVAPPEISNADTWKVQPEMQSQATPPVSIEKKYCGNCGKEVNPQATSCPGCGVKLQPE